MRINFSISLDETAASIVVDHATKDVISKSKYINDVLKMQQKTPREKIMEVSEILKHFDKLNENNIKKIVEIIEKNINKI